MKAIYNAKENVMIYTKDKYDSYKTLLQLHSDTDINSLVDGMEYEISIIQLPFENEKNPADITYKVAKIIESEDDTIMIDILDYVIQVQIGNKSLNEFKNWMMQNFKIERR